jgi:hypothetical protein
MKWWCVNQIIELFAFVFCFIYSSDRKDSLYAYVCKVLSPLFPSLTSCTFYNNYVKYFQLLSIFKQVFGLDTLILNTQKIHFTNQNNSLPSWKHPVFYYIMPTSTTIWILTQHNILLSRITLSSNLPHSHDLAQHHYTNFKWNRTEML